MLGKNTRKVWCCCCCCCLETKCEHAEGILKQISKKRKERKKVRKEKKSRRREKRDRKERAVVACSSHGRHTTSLSEKKKVEDRRGKKQAFLARTNNETTTL